MSDETRPSDEELVKPIERPGVTINKTLAELLALDGTTPVEVEWQERMKSIAEAEARAWAARDLHKLAQFDGFTAGFVAGRATIPDRDAIARAIFYATVYGVKNGMWKECKRLGLAQNYWDSADAVLVLLNTKGEAKH